MTLWLAPKPRPIAIERKVKANSSGSFKAVRNLTIDSAPTNPRDNANDDFTILIIIIVVILMIEKLFAKLFLFDKLRAYLVYIYANEIDNT